MKQIYLTCSMATQGSRSPTSESALNSPRDTVGMQGWHGRHDKVFIAEWFNGAKREVELNAFDETVHYLHIDAQRGSSRSSCSYNEMNFVIDTRRASNIPGEVLA